MYETLEHWNQYKQEKQLQAKLAEEFKLKQAKKVADLKEFDEWFAKLIAKNGTTNY